MDPRLQAGLELQLEKQAQQEHNSSLSGVLGQYFKQAEYVSVADTIPPANLGAFDLPPSAQDRFEQQGGKVQTTTPRRHVTSSAVPIVTSTTTPAPSATDVEAARQDHRFPTQSRKTVQDNFASRLRNFLGSSGKRSMLQAGPLRKGTLAHELSHNKD